MQSNFEKRQLLEELLTQAEKVRNTSVYKAESLGRPAYDLASELDDDNAKAKAMYFIYIGSYFGKKKNNQHLLQEALQMIASDEAAYIVRFNNLLGLENIKIGCYAFALDYLIKALDVAQKAQLNAMVCMVLNNTGEVFRNLGDHNRALAYYLEAYELLSNQEENTEKYHCYALDNLIISYCEIGDRKRANYYLEILETLDENDGISRTLYEYTRGCYFKLIQAYQEAIVCFNIFLEQIVQLNMLPTTIDTYKHLGDCYSALNKDYNAIDSYVKGYDISGNDEYSESRMYCSSKLAELYKKVNKVEKAIDYYKGFGETYFDWHKKSNNLRSDYMVHKLQFQQLKAAKSYVEEEHRQTLIGHEAVQKSYRRLDLAVTIGNALKSNPSFKELLILLKNHMNELMEVASIGIARYNKADESLSFFYIIENSVVKNDISFDLKRSECFNMKTCIQERSSILFRTREEDKSERMPDYKYQNAYREIQSALYVPIISSNMVKGVLTVQSKKPYAYSDEDLKVLEIISAFFSQIDFDES